MSFCPCGKEAAEGGPLCDRCAALQVLELTPTAAPSDIRAAYYMLVKVWHPDRFQFDASLRQAANEKLKAVNSAYVYLTSGVSAARPRRKPTRAPQEAYYAAAAQAPAPATSAATRSRRGTLPNWLAAFGRFSVLQRIAVLAVGLGGSAIFAKVLDSTLASDPETARVYLEYRSAMMKELNAPKQRLWSSIEDAYHRLRPQPSLLATTPAAAEPPSQPAASASQPSRKRVALTKLQPFITVGMTKDEVIAIAGTPTTISDDKLDYGGSEFNLKDGAVTGWKIDAASSLRVKLWPGSAADRTLRVFSVDSTKDDVLVVQGTPTLLSQDKFGYGASEVYFRNNRVVSWKNDPGSVMLRAVSR